MQDLDWNDLQYVLALSRAGNLASAAQDLRVNETTVARRIARIEKGLASKLFERTDGVLLATEVGQIVVERAERIEVDVGEITIAATGADARAVGTVNITTIPLLANRVLLPAIPRLLDAHPLLLLHVIAEPRNLSLTRREADIALRLGRPERDQRAIARRVGEIAYAVYGRKGSPPQTLPWIGYDESRSASQAMKWIVKAIKDEPDAKIGLIVNDSDAAFHAVCAGLGRTLIPCSIGDQEPGLSRVSGTRPVLIRELWILVHHELRHLARIKAVVG